MMDDFAPGQNPFAKDQADIPAGVNPFAQQPAPASRTTAELGPRDNSFLAEARRQLGMVARTGANVVTSPLQVGGNALAKAMNALVGQDAGGKPVFGLPSEQINKGLNWLGLPEPAPDRPIEQFTQGMAQSAPAVALPAAFAPQIVGNAAVASSLAQPGQELREGGIGAAGGAVGSVLGRSVKALTPTAEAQALIDKGVPLTYGQRLGPPIQRVESVLAKVPYVGAPIRARQAEALQGWQQATRDAASPGARTIDEVGGNLGARYKELLPTEPFAHVPKIDPTPLGYAVLEKAPGITPEMLTNIEREVVEAIAHADSPALFHQGVSTLKGIAHQYKTSADPTHRLYGNGLSAAADKVSETWRAGLSKEVQGELANVDKAWSQFVPIRSASTKYVQTLDNPENYTPRMLQQTLRMRDPTLGKTSFRETPQGQLAHQGEQTVGSASNNPTAGSGILSLLLGGGATAFGHTPAAASTAALGYLYGTKPAQQALIGTLPVQRLIAEALRRGTAPATVSLTRSPQDE